MGKQGPPSIVIVAALAVVKAGLAHIRNHLPHGQQQQAQQHNAALVRQLTHVGRAACRGWWQACMKALRPGRPYAQLPA